MSDAVPQSWLAARWAEAGFLRWLASRLAFAALVLFVLSVIVFLATSLLPVNAVDQMLGSEATEAGRIALTKRLGLDRPPLERYFIWVGHALRLDFGRSMFSAQPVWPLVAERFANSLRLAGAIMLVQLPLALGLGIWTAVHRGGPADRIVSAAVLVFICVPEFVAGIILIWLLSVQFPVFPALSLITSGSTASDWLVALCLPVLAMLPVGTSYLIRTMRFAMAEVLDREFIQLAALRGLSRARIVLRHAVPNALGAMVNVLALHVAFLLSGVVAIEVLFEFPGIGRLLLDSVGLQDVPLVQACALVLGTGYVLINLAADIAVALIDPRVGSRIA